MFARFAVTTFAQVVFQKYVFPKWCGLDSLRSLPFRWVGEELNCSEATLTSEVR